MSIEIFSVVYRPGIDESPLTLLCQAVDVDGEKFLWVDGVNPDEPVMISISAVKSIQWVGTFKDLLTARMDLAESLMAESLGQHSPTILARAMAYMAADKKLGAHEALEIADSQGLDILDADSHCSVMFAAELKAHAPSVAC